MNEQDLTELKKSNNFKKLNNLVNKFNIFDCLKITRTEIRHSNFLAWLLNPKETHKLKDIFLKEFINNLIIKFENNKNFNFYSKQEFKKFDLSNTEILREYKNIDILLIDDTHKFIVIIENKIDSFQHDNQLQSYKDFILKNYSNEYKKIYLYLSPNKEKIEEPYLYIDYNFIKKILQNLLKNMQINQKIKQIIEDYVDIIERDIMDKDNIRILCREIYKEHKTTIDTICKYIDLRKYIANLIQEIIEEDEQLELLESNTSWIRFIPRHFDFNSLKFAKNDWVNSNRILMFEINNERNHIYNDIIIRQDNENNHSEKRKELLNIAKNKNNKFEISQKENSYEHIKTFDIINKNKYDDFITLSENEIKQKIKNELKNNLQFFAEIATEFNNKYQNL